MSGFILCPVHGEHLSKSVCEYGVFVSNSAKLPLRFINIVEHHHRSKNLDLSGNIALGAKDDLLEKLSNEEEIESKTTIKSGRELLNKLELQAKQKSQADVSIAQIHGEVVENLLELKNDISLLILGVSDTSEHTIGENVKEIIREVHQPVLLVNSEFTQPKKIMIAYNGSHESKQILQIVANNPFFGDVERTIVTVDKNPTRGEKLLSEAKEIFENKNIPVETKLFDTTAKEAILEEFETGNYDILVMGAYSHSRMKEFMFGSLTSYILENIKKPILLYR